MFPTRVPGFGNTMNHNRKRRRGPTTSPVVGRRRRPSLEALETRQLLSTYYVTNTNDSGDGSLPSAITSANLDHSADDIVFHIPAADSQKSALLDFPEGDIADGYGGFDPGTQTWRIKLVKPLPAITNTVSIDGYTEAPVGVPYRYPNAISSAVQSIAVTGSPTGGTFTLKTAAPFAVNTITLPYNATAATVQAALGPY